MSLLRVISSLPSRQPSWFLAAVALLFTSMPVASHTIDSLYQVFLVADATHKTDAANTVMRHLHEARYCDTLTQFSNKDKLAVVQARTHYQMAEYYFEEELFEDALEAANQAQDWSGDVKNRQFDNDVVRLMANAHLGLGNYDKALEKLLEAYKIDKQVGSDELISIDLNTLAGLYLIVQLPGPGINFIEKAIAIERKLKRADQLAVRLGLGSKLYLMNKQPDKAMIAINEAIAIDEKSGNDEKRAYHLVQKAAVLEEQGQSSQALALLLKALPPLVKSENHYSLALCYNQLAGLYSKASNKQLALSYYKKALEQSIKCGSSKAERTAEYGLWESMRETNPNIAMHHLERYTALNDSLHNNILTTRMRVLEATLLNQEQQEQSSRNRNFITWAITLLLLMACLMAAGLFYVWRKSKRALALQQQTHQLRSHFLANITHELQTPLTVVMNSGQQLMESPKTSAEERKQLGKMLLSHGQRMLKLVNNLIDIENTRDGAEVPSSKQGDIVMFIHMLVDNFTELANKQRIDLVFLPQMASLFIVFFPDYIRKIVHILIDNAIKYTPAGGKITVTFATAESNKMRITVSDTGKSIPTSELNHIFEPFSQGFNDDDDGVETALELSLVNQLVNKMGGTIAVNSMAGVGTTFTIDLPMRLDDSSFIESKEQVQQFVEHRINGSNDSTQKPMAFVVENNEDVAFFIASHLHNSFNLRFANDGYEAYSNAQDLVPDLIVTSINMPVMGGKELIARLRANAALNHIPIIAMTSSTSDQERIQCIEAGADAVLVKPFNSNELTLLANKLTKQRSSMRNHIVKTRVNDSSAQSTLSKEDKAFINKLIDVVHSQMVKGDVDMEHIAAALSISRKQLRTRVHSITGLMPVAFVLRVRLNYARRMVRNEDTPLTIIAQKCGFQNLSHFSKAFKQQFKISPQQYRKSMDDINDSPPESW